MGGTQLRPMPAYVPGSFVPFIGSESTRTARPTATWPGPQCAHLRGDVGASRAARLARRKGCRGTVDALSGYQAITYRTIPPRVIPPAWPPVSSTDFGPRRRRTATPGRDLLHSRELGSGWNKKSRSTISRRIVSVEAALMRSLDTHDPGYSSASRPAPTRTVQPGSVEEDGQFVEAELEGPYTGGITAALAIEDAFRYLRCSRLGAVTSPTSGPRIVLSFTAGLPVRRSSCGGRYRVPGAPSPSS